MHFFADLDHFAIDTYEKSYEYFLDTIKIGDNCRIYTWSPDEDEYGEQINSFGDYPN